LAVRRGDDGREPEGQGGVSKDDVNEGVDGGARG
jgi:hypothetical protein